MKNQKLKLQKVTPAELRELSLLNEAADFDEPQRRAHPVDADLSLDITSTSEKGQINTVITNNNNLNSGNAGNTNAPAVTVSDERSRKNSFTLRKLISVRLIDADTDIAEAERHLGPECMFETRELDLDRMKRMYPPEEEVMEKECRHTITWKEPPNAVALAKKSGHWHSVSHSGTASHPVGTIANYHGPGNAESGGSGTGSKELLSYAEIQKQIQEERLQQVREARSKNYGFEGSRSAQVSSGIRGGGEVREWNM